MNFYINGAAVMVEFTSAETLPVPVGVQNSFVSQVQAAGGGRFRRRSRRRRVGRCIACLRTSSRSRGSGRAYRSCCRIGRDRFPTCC
jgi:hypothetical protein